MAQGTIKRLAERGYGFIDRGTYGFVDRGAKKDLFFQSTALEEVAFDALHEGDRVEFDIEVGTLGSGDRAIRIRRLP